MIIDRTLAAAFIDNNVRHRVFGRCLTPFSLWHRFLLMTIQSPFMVGGDLTFFDIRNAIGICSLRYPQCRIRRPWIVPVLWMIWCGPFKKKWIKRLGKTRDKLLEYFGDYISKPEFNLWHPDLSYHGPSIAPPPRLGPVPEVFSILSDVISFLHCSPTDAWNTPVGQAYWWQMAALRQAGENINFMDESEREFQAKMREAKGA